ncbi:peroxiredoxin family protein [Sphingomonas flavalba]|uniref:peroxiredoxin family protein n=1 Tax=Sphingomonas flavalba TaxID=2559804 RepID=UPI0039E19950
MADFRPAPELDVTEWLNTPEPLSLSALRGRVVVAEAFQMLCPGCAQMALPQLARVHEQFSRMGVAVLGLHTVFEHHEAQGPRSALEAFLREYRYSFPVGIDRPAPEGRGMPVTMAAYRMEGTPTLILIDRHGRLRRQAFGHVPDLQLGAEIMALIAERDAA